MTITLGKRLHENLLRRPYGTAYVAEQVRIGIAHQIRALREQRGWTQSRFAEAIGKPQSVVSRLEDPDYGKLSLQTLLKIAATFDVALVVRFTNFSDFLLRTRDLSPDALRADPFDEQELDTPSAMSRDTKKVITYNIPPPDYYSAMAGNPSAQVKSQTPRGFQATTATP